MRIAAIIAEYNPFHNGHAYQIRRIRELNLADHILVIMSGDFVQRGAPAVIDKYSRTKMALLGGADAVIELPVRYACGSAEFFAAGAVSILNALGCVDDLCFGCENAESVEYMKKLAYILNHPSEDFRRALQDALRQGLSWPQARMQALMRIFDAPAISANTLNGTASASVSVNELLASPNNLLAIEYLRALEKMDSSIHPAAIRREGAGYHDPRIHTASEKNKPCSSGPASERNKPCSSGFASGSNEACHSGPASAIYSSASAIRRELQTSGLTLDVASAVPSETQKLLAQHYQKNFPVLANDFSGLLHYLLLQKTAQELCEFQDITPDLANKIIRSRSDFQSFDQFCMLLKSRDLTYSRISRSLMHMILGIPKLTADEIRPEYARLLGFRKDSSALLSRIKKCSSIPLITRAAEFDRRQETLPDAFKEDLFAADLYSSIAAQKFGCAYKNEYQKQIILK